MRAAATVAAMILLVGCSESGPLDPNETDARRAIEMFMNARGQEYHMIETSPLRCTQAIEDGVPIAICEVCTTNVGTGSFIHPDQTTTPYVFISGDVLTIPFKRAARITHPDVAPANPREGLWVLSGEITEAADYDYDYSERLEGSIADQVGFVPSLLDSPSDLFTFFGSLENDENSRILLDHFGRCATHAQIDLDDY